MEDYTNLKSAQVINVKGEVRTNSIENESLRVGSFIKPGDTLSLAKDSEINLSFSDGSQQRVHSYLDEIRVENHSLAENTKKPKS
jgi:hypothetical protein